jgi:hypothetical protein
LGLAVLHVLRSLAGDLAEEELIEMPVVDGEMSSALPGLAEDT